MNAQIIQIIETTLYIFIQILSYAVLIRCIFSWLPMGRNNGFYKLLYAVTEPILAPVRKMIARSPIGGGMPIDFSPVLTFFIIEAIYTVIVNILNGFT